MRKNFADWIALRSLSGLLTAAQHLRPSILRRRITTAACGIFAASQTNDVLTPAVSAQTAGQSHRNAKRLLFTSLVAVATAIVLTAYLYWDGNGTTANSGTTPGSDEIDTPDILKTSTGDTTVDAAVLLRQSQIWQDNASELLVIGAINAATGFGNTFTLSLISTVPGGVTLDDLIENAASEANESAPTINTTNATTDVTRSETYSDATTTIPSTVNHNRNSHGFRHATAGHTRLKRRILHFRH
jgi:hypothetical protein